MIKLNAAKVSRPSISVCIATYNGASFIVRQLATVLPQLRPDDEVVVSDDSSSDNTLELIYSFNDQRIRIFPGQQFRSPTYNFEHALKQSRGEIIFLADQDDEWTEGWVEVALQHLTEVSLVVSNMRIIDAEGSVIMQPGDRANKRRPTSGTFKNLYRNSYIGCCCAFRREVLKIALPFPHDLPWHDWWIGLIADVFFKTRFLDEPFIRYRRHSSNASPTSEKSPFPLSRKLHMRLIMARSLSLRIIRRAIKRDIT